MIRTLLIFLGICLIGIQFSIGQTYGNEWITYNQKYFKIPVVQSGFYKLDFTVLNDNGIPTSSFNISNIQVFGKEQEVPLFVHDGNSNDQMDPGDYVAFYGERNDGWLDKDLYSDPTHPSSPHYSLYNDTLFYFFTYNNSDNNLRYDLETANNFSDFTPETYVWRQNHIQKTDKYFEGFNQSSLSTSFYIAGEGYSGEVKGNLDGISQHAIKTLHPYTAPGAPNANLVTSSISANRPTPAVIGGPTHHLVLEWGANNTTILDTLYTGIEQIYSDLTVPANSLTSGQTILRWQVGNGTILSAGNDLQRFSYATLRYPSTTNLNDGGIVNGHFFIQNGNSNKVRLDLTNWSANNPMILVDGNSPKQIRLYPNGTNNYQVLIPNDPLNEEQRVHYVDSLTFLSPLSISQVTPTGFFTDFTTPPDSALLMVYHPALLEASDNYRAYRSSAAGGNYNVVFANINELYLQFGGGIPKHINGIRRFAHLQYNASTVKPSGLFLMGKGIKEAFANGTAGTRNNANNYKQSLIPSFGQPSSDIAITATLQPTETWAPLIPTGRVSVPSNKELQIYLDKIIEFDQQQNQNSVYSSDTKDWQKQVLHFGGGTNAIEQGTFRQYLENMEDVITDYNFGANVTKLYKQNSDPFDPTLVSAISDRLSSGVSLINFFGHANSQESGFEINIDNPNNWNNQGKYPIVMANTCFNGNIFNPASAGVSTSETFVNTQNSGAIAFVSSVHLGFSNTLASISYGMYQQMSQNAYGKSIGEQMMRNAQNLYDDFAGPDDNRFESNTLQYVLNGDPMLKLNWHEKPEIELRAESVSFSPELIDLTVDSITVNIQLKNLGRTFDEDFLLEVRRDFPASNIDSVYFINVDGLNYTKTIQVKMPLLPAIGVGLNRISIKADIPSFVDENFDEDLNNRLTKNLFINIEGITPIAPYEFAVVPNPEIILKASTISPIANSQTYRFEIDTTDLFNSPERRYYTVTSTGGVIEAGPNDWKFVSSNSAAPLVFTDSTVYFWRVAKDESNPKWKEMSFQYIPGKTGWGQDHFFQFKKNDFVGVGYNRTNRNRLFVADTVPVEIRVNGGTGAADYPQNIWFLDNQFQEYNLCTPVKQIHVAVIDPITMQPWGTRDCNTGLPNRYYNNFNDAASGVGCVCRSQKAFFFRYNTQELTGLQNMINNEVPDGHYVLIYGPGGARFDLMQSIDSAGMFGLFESLGSNDIVAGTPNAPFAFFAQKGDPSTAVEIVGQSAAPIVLKAEAISNPLSGLERSTLIGPAAEWGNFYWKNETFELTGSDTTYLAIEAYDYNGSFAFDESIAVNADDSILSIANYVDALDHPFIRLKAIYEDTSSFTPAQMDRWHVLFQPLPEAAIDGSNGYYWSAAGKDSVEAGEDISFAIDVKNISDLPMDSLLISYYVEDNNQTKQIIAYPRQDSLRVGASFRDTVTFNTRGMTGKNLFWMEVNPYVGTSNITDQPEQFHFNNLLQIPFNVREDRINPLLDVTFDGRHILNGDIVNPNAEILITLKDENEFLIMDDVSDTSSFGVYLTDPDGNQERIYFEVGGQTVMQWIPADATNKKFKIIYPSAFEKDGNYTLLVQGSDKSGNISGDIEYRVSFEVIHESSITYMMNYPNPFSTSTRFVFTLTGTEVPDEMIIQIMTINGKVVREITEQEFGRIYIGKNISEYAWDGTDEFGDPLANGVYLYRVMMEMNGESIEHRDSGADQYFTKEFGKMYLMR